MTIEKGLSFSCASDGSWRRFDERVGRVDYGSIPRTACELRSFSFIERRLLCWVGRTVRFRLVFDDAEREERVVSLRVVSTERKELCLGSRAVRFRLILTILQEASEAVMLVSWHCQAAQAVAALAVCVLL